MWIQIIVITTYLITFVYFVEKEKMKTTVFLRKNVLTLDFIVIWILNPVVFLGNGSGAMVNVHPAQGKRLNQSSTAHIILCISQSISLLGQKPKTCYIQFDTTGKYSK